MILLTHPIHGAKHCYNATEEAADAANGWVRADAAPVEQAGDSHIERIETEIAESFAPVQQSPVQHMRRPRGPNKPKA